MNKFMASKRRSDSCHNNALSINHIELFLSQHLTRGNKINAFMIRPLLPAYRGVRDDRKRRKEDIITIIIA